ncbi:MAG: toxin-antitoxin system HicB family antitoxin [Actinomycetota bacterium]|nr:toxin-antitoxin system HicB family antitoxin [Actinomycetota bacterium]
MELSTYVDSLREDLATAAEAGGADARALAERLTAPLASAIRLTLLDALGAAAAEISRDLAPGSVDLRLRGREPSFVVTTPRMPEPPLPPLPVADMVVPSEDEGTVARINLRLGQDLKDKLERAAKDAGLSVNAWLVRAAAAALAVADQDISTANRAPRSSQRYSGWVH